MKVLITGGAGFIGSNTANLFEKLGNKVLIYDNFSTGRSENLQGFKGKVCIGDITDDELLDKAFFDFEPEIVVHLAAQSAITTSLTDPKKDLKINTLGTLNVIQCCQKFTVKHLIFSSTSAVYWANPFFWRVNERSECDPATPYGVSKLASEMYIRQMFPAHTILRLGNVFGPRQHPIGENQVVARAFRHFLYGDQFKVIGNGRQKRDFVYVDDVAFAILMSATERTRGIFNTATGKSHSVLEVLSCIEKVYEVRGYKWEHSHGSDPRGSVGLDVKKIKRELGWQAMVNLQSGIMKTFQWWEVEKKKRKTP